MSAPIVEKGHDGFDVSSCGSGLKEISNGCAPMSEVRSRFRSISIFEL